MFPPQSASKSFSSSVRTVRATLTPTPGFVCKTLTTQASTYAQAHAGATPVDVPRGRKVFINICYDAHVPPPAEVSEAEKRRAMLGDGNWGVPVVVSEGRTDTDRAGKPSLVFDTVFHPSLAARVKADSEFKIFIQELALERVEDKSGLSLSRDTSSPNIPSKGTLQPRPALVPAPVEKPRIEVLSDTPAEAPSAPKAEPLPAQGAVPDWSWAEDALGTGVEIVVHVPSMTRSHYPATTLDLEPRRLILSSPAFSALDLDLRSLPRDVDVAKARAEWRVGQRNLVILTAWA